MTEEFGDIRSLKALRAAEQWIVDRRSVWQRRLDRLGAYLAEQPETPEEGEKK